MILDLISKELDMISLSDYKRIQYIGINLSVSNVINYKVYYHTDSSAPKGEYKHKCFDYLEYDSTVNLWSFADYRKHENSFKTSKKVDYFVNTPIRDEAILSLSKLNNYFGINLELSEFTQIGDLLYSAISNSTYPMQGIGIEFDQDDTPCLLKVYYRTRTYEKLSSGRFADKVDNKLLLNVLVELSSKTRYSFQGYLLGFIKNIIETSFFDIYLLCLDIGKSDIYKFKIYFQNKHEFSSTVFIQELAGNSQLCELITPHTFSLITNMINKYPLFFDGFCISINQESNLALNLYFKPS